MLYYLKLPCCCLCPFSVLSILAPRWRQLRLIGFCRAESIKHCCKNSFHHAWVEGVVSSRWNFQCSCLSNIILNGCLIPFSPVKLYVQSMLVCISGLGNKVVFEVLIYNATSNCAVCHLNAEIQCKTCRSAYGSIMNSKWIYFWSLMDVSMNNKWVHSDWSQKVLVMVLLFFLSSIIKESSWTDSVWQAVFSCFGTDYCLLVCRLFSAVLHIVIL